MDIPTLRVIGLDALQDGFSYLTRNPGYLLRAAVNAARLRFGFPVASMRWLIDHMPKRGKGPTEIELHPAPPALRAGASFDLMGTLLRASADLHVEGVRVADGQLLIELRVRNLEVQAPPESPASQMIKAMDLTRPGNLMMFMPQRPPALVEARDDLFVFDLMKLRKLRDNEKARRAISALAEVLSIKDIQVEGDLLVIGLRVSPLGMPSALAQIRA
jgi:hypothetical protein